MIWLRRIGWTLLIVLPLGALGGWAALGPMAKSRGRAAAERIAERLDLDLHIGRIANEGVFGLRFDHVRLGPSEAPLITVGSARGALTYEEFRAGKRRPKHLELTDVTVHTRGDGSLEGALRALKASLPKRKAAAEPSAKKRPLPSVALRRARLIDHGGALEISGINVDFADGQYKGEMDVITPDLGPCAFSGSFQAISLSCERAFQKTLPGGFRVVASKVEIERKPKLIARVPDLHLRVPAERKIAKVLGGSSFRASVTVDLSAASSDKLPAKMVLHLPGGGEVAAEGEATLQGRRPISARFTTRFDGLKLSAVHKVIKAGDARGEAQLQVDLRERTATLDGDLRLTEVEVEHRKLAESRIGPFDMRTGGKLAVSIGETPEALHLTVVEGHFSLGKLAFVGHAEIDTRGAAPIAKLAVKTPRTISGESLSEAIPKGLLPHLSPLEFGGIFNFEGALELDMAQIKKMVLKADVDTRGLRILGWNKAIDFNRLRESFETHFEMPDGEIFTRLVGPMTDRWVPLEEIPELLPQAVVSQEDGGFYRHGGISMLHLRGSLIRNLERGRFARGGSTLSMQLARNIFLNRRKTLSRKLEEIILTWQLEQAFEKDELMTLYLNVVEFGPDVFGIREAAETYFQRTPAQLTPTQIAFITRLLPAPRKYHKQLEKKTVSRYYKKSMNRLLNLLVKKGHLDPEEREAMDPALIWEEPIPLEGGEVPEDQPFDPFAPVPAPPPDPRLAPDDPLAPVPLRDPWGNPMLDPVEPRLDEN